MGCLIGGIIGGAIISLLGYWLGYRHKHVDIEKMEAVKKREETDKKKLRVAMKSLED